MTKEKYIKNTMKRTKCTREIAEIMYNIKIKLESDDYTTEDGKEIYKQLKEIQQES